MPLINLSPTEIKRIKIKAMLKAGKTIKEVAFKLGVTRQTVAKCKLRKSIKDKKRSGRPTKVSPKTKMKIREIMKNKYGSSTRNCVKNLNGSFDFIARGKTISRRTVQRYLLTTDWGKTAYKITKTPFLTKKNVSDRIKFMEIVRKEGYVSDGRIGKDLRNNILWTDESPIDLHPKPNSQNYRIRTANKKKINNVKVPKFSLQIMVASGFTAQGVTELHIVEDGCTVNGKYYREKILPIYLEALKTDLFSSKAKATMMHDGAPAHTAKLTEDLIREHYSKFWGKGVWPGNSPDINPVENLWSILQNLVFEEPRPTNRTELIDRVLKTWKSFPLDLLTNLAQSFKRRIIQLEERQGLKVDY